MNRRVFVVVALAFAGCSGNGNPTPIPDGGAGCSFGQEKFMDVCLTTPTTPATRTPCGDVTEYCDKTSTTTPNLDCLTAPPKMHPATPATVTLTGFVHPFSSGNSNSPVTIQVFKASDLADGKDILTATPVVPSVAVGFDPSKATDPTQFRACDSDPKVGCVPVTPDACTGVTCFDGLSGRSDQGQYCHTVGGQGVCSSRLRWEPRFSIDGVPTNTPLVIRTSGMNAAADQVWAVMVQWNVFLASDDKSCGGDSQATDCLDTSDAANPRYQENVNVLSESDYGNIPVVVGLQGISQGLSAVAGELHDCDNVRISGAQVGINPAAARFTYFNGNPYDTLPDPSRASTGTDRLGLYAALNIAPGKFVVEADGLVGGKEVLIGKFTGFTYPNSVATVNLNGGKPQP